MRITEYSAQADKLNPVESGYSAQERAGRLLGTLYRDQASDVKEGGQVQGQEIRDEAWPLAFDRFRAARGGGVRFIGGRSGGGGRTMYAGPHGNRELSDGAPRIARLARAAVNHPDKVWKQPNVQLDEMNAIDKAANDWYYDPNRETMPVGNDYGGGGTSPDVIDPSIGYESGYGGGDQSSPALTPSSQEGVDAQNQGASGGILSDITGAASSVWNFISSNL